MSGSRTHQRHAAAGVPVRRVLLGTLVAALFVSGIVALSEGLRHPHPEALPRDDLGVHDDDPRDDIECEEPEAREGRPDAPDRADEPISRVTSGELHDCPTTWDGRAVRFQGEVVGALLRRTDGAWVQLNDDIYADLEGPLPGHQFYRGGNAGVGVFIPHELADEVEWIGGPMTQGDVVEITGRFLRADPRTREAVVIMADGGEILRPGAPFAAPPLRDRYVAAAVLTVLAVGFALLERLAARRRRFGRPLVRRGQG